MPKHVPRPKQKRRKVKRVRPKKQLRRARGGSVEKKILKLRWMNALQALVGYKEINWNLANMYFDQGVPVQAAFQKLVLKEVRVMKTFKEYSYPKKKDYVSKDEQEIIDTPQPHWDRWDIQEWKKKKKKKRVKKNKY